MTEKKKKKEKKEMGGAGRGTAQNSESAFSGRKSLCYRGQRISSTVKTARLEAKGSVWSHRQSERRVTIAFPGDMGAKRSSGAKARLRN